jgi:hypothetical protein
MGYSVYVQRYSHGEEATIPYRKLVDVFSGLGTLGSAGSYIEFTPYTDELCEVAILSGDEAGGITSISFERPGASAALADLVFQLLAIPGTCFFEADCTYVKARTDVTKNLPEELLDQCETGQVTIVTSAEEVRI